MMKQPIAVPWVVSCLLILVTAIPTEATNQKNVLLIIADDLGMELGCYGDAEAKTPNIDRLATEGTRFANAFAAVASCSPSRATILTGMQVHQNGQYGLAHPPHAQRTLERIQSLPKLLNDAGYRSAVVGKNHVGPKTVYPYTAELGPTHGSTRNPSGMAEAAKTFMAADPNQPFFLVMGFVDPHRIGPNFSTDDNPNDGYDEVRFDPQAIEVPAFLPDTPMVREDLAGYYQAVARLDECVAQTLKALDETGHRDDTLVIFVSDNGMPFPGAKTTVYDAGVHLPMIIRQPGAPTGNVNDAIVSFIDIFPTVLEWTGAQAPKYKLFGQSLLPQLAKKSDDARGRAFSSHIFHEIDMYYPMRSVRTPQYRLIWNLAHDLPVPSAADVGNSPSMKSIRQTGKMGGRTIEAFFQRPEFELYDIHSDPNELKNLVEDPSQAKTLEQLKGELLKMMNETKDPWLRDRTPEEAKGKLTVER